MRSMTETQALRDVAAVLHEVANGETVLITRDDGAPFARIVPTLPPAVSDGPAAADLIAEVIENNPLSEEAIDELEKNIREHRAWIDDRMREWPTD